MEFDIVIVGAGPAGLAAAIRLKQLNADLSVVVVEKGSEVGAHILSGAVIDPVALDELLPDWREDADSPLKTPVTGRPLLLDDGGRRDPAAQFLMPPLMNNHGIYRLARQCLPLAGAAGRSAGRRDLSGLCRDRGALRRHGAVAASRPATWASPGTAVTRTLHPRHGTARQVHAVRRGCARLAVQAADRAIRARMRQRAAEIRHRDQGSCGKSIPRSIEPGLIQHTFGWPLDNRTGGGSFLYHLDDNQVAVGFVVHLNYEDPYLSPFDEFQRFKTHPRSHRFEGGKRLAYGARAITEGGYQSVPQA